MQWEFYYYCHSFVVLQLLFAICNTRACKQIVVNLQGQVPSLVLVSDR
jgi:hypothetical protein